MDYKVITVNITENKIQAARQCLIDNGIAIEEADTVLQALGYILLDQELCQQT